MVISIKILTEVLNYLIEIEKDIFSIKNGVDSNKNKIISNINSVIEIINKLDKFDNLKQMLKCCYTKLTVDMNYSECLIILKNIFMTLILPDFSILEGFDNAGSIKIENFLSNVPDYENLKEFSYYILSKLYKKSDPYKSYKYGISVFETNNKFANNYNIKYIYNPDSVKEYFFDKCPICQSDRITPFFNIEQFRAPGVTTLFSPYKLWNKCEDCTNLFAYNFPISNMAIINGHYSAFMGNMYIEPRYPLRIYSDIFNNCRKYTKGKKYLEIGVGNGEMISCALEMGYEITAVEICKEDCENISNVLDIDIINDNFINVDFNEKFDIIIMGDVLEHVSEPKEALRKIKYILNTNGVLWISTPNYLSAFSRMRKDKDPMWNQKNHFTYFCYDGLNRILRELGFKVDRYDISLRYNGSMELYVTMPD